MINLFFMIVEHVIPECNFCTAQQVLGVELFAEVDILCKTLLRLNFVANITIYIVELTLLSCLIFDTFLTLVLIFNFFVINLLHEGTYKPFFLDLFFRVEDGLKRTQEHIISYLVLLMVS